MKRLLIIIDGMDDVPIPGLGNITPASFASMPALSYMRRHGETSYLQTIPAGQEASTEVALMTILGQPIGADFNARSWFEALGGGVEIADNDLCLRCNLITHRQGIIESHCGHNPAAEECRDIVDLLNKHFQSDEIHFHCFGNFRNLLVMRNCRSEVKAQAPHTLIGQPIDLLQIKSDDSRLEKKLNRFIADSRKILSQQKANGIALWAPGHKVAMPHRISGSVIAGVNVVKGIGIAAGMSAIDVPGATGDEHTDYDAKLRATFTALKNDDFVLLHIEAADEASHERDWHKKARILEEIDRKVLSPLLAEKTGSLQITVQADHPTSSLSGKHLTNPVTVIKYDKPE